MSDVNDAAILTEIDGRTLVITMNRPAARNAVNLELANGMAAALERLDRDDGLTVGIITGANGTFCSGMDLKGFLAGELPVTPDRGFAGIVRKPPAKPLIAAVDGYALAGGMEIALACDLIVANDQAQFGIPEVKRGLCAGAGGLIRLPRQLPYRVAMEFALTGAFLPAQRAHELGLVNRLADGAALDAALNLAREIAANGPMAVKAAKQVVMQSRLWSESEMWELQEQILDPVTRSADAQEGARAFAEKRAPVWTGQ